jgi:tRNA pseudouridine55 synthase
MKERLDALNGAILIDKPAGMSSFGVIEALQRQLCEGRGLRRRDLPKLGHGGTLDPFATGLLAVCAGRAVKLARYFLGATKHYEGVIRFGETTVPGDPTSPVSETSPVMPASIDAIRAMARQLTLQPYLQTPPMHSAKKRDGKPLYELARQGIEIEREPKLCRLSDFEILAYEAPRARFRVTCSSGTYIRTLAQDFGRLLGTVAMLESLSRTGAGQLRLADAWPLDRVKAALREGKLWDELPCWVPFDRLLDGYDRAEATSEETEALLQGRQNVLFNILRRAPAASPGQENEDAPCIAIYNSRRLVAVARREQGVWGLERVFA